MLHVVGAMNRGGVETWLMHVLHQSDRTRFQHEFIVHSTKPGAYDDEIRSMGSALFPIPLHRNPALYTLQLRRHLRRHGPYDVVHSHVHHFSGVVLRATAQENVRCRIAHSHNDTTQVESQAGRLRRSYLALMKRWIERYATDCVAASREAARALSGVDWQRESRWTVLYYGHDFAPFRRRPDRASVRAEMGLAPNAVVVGHVGRFDPQKNHTFLLRIASELVSHEPSVRVLLIGDGPLRKSMESQAAALGLEDVVVFAGLRPDVSRLLLGAIDVFLFPSTHEGLPLTCTEAQAAAVPLVISDSITPELDAIPSLVTRLPLSESPAHWAEECLKAMSRPRIARGEAVRILEQSAFDIQICVRRLEDIYTRTNRQLLFADSPLSASCV